jgi:hypothetical protein
MAEHEGHDYKATGPAAIGFQAIGSRVDMGVEGIGIDLGVHGKGVGREGTTSPGPIGVKGEATHGTGVLGTSTSQIGVDGSSDAGRGVRGTGGLFGVEGVAQTVGEHLGTIGVRGEGPTGVYGKGNPQDHHAQPPEPSIGVHSECPEFFGTGVLGGSLRGFGVHGRSALSYGGVFTSTGSAPIRLEPAATTVGPPTSREHLSGELFVDARGTLY